MHNDVHLCLSDLLDQDTSSNEFFQTLSPAVQRKLINKDIRTFEELQKCADSFRRAQPDNRGVMLDRYSSVCSSGDCTGLIPRGSNMTESEYKTYQEMYPFGASQEQ